MLSPFPLQILICFDLGRYTRNLFRNILQLLRMLGVIFIGPAVLFTEGMTYVLLKKFCGFWVPVHTGGKIDTPIPHCCMMVPPP